jgi:heme exporter protein D
MDYGPHAAFIWASYGATGAILTALVLRAILDERKQRRVIARLEAQGIRRRSDAQPRTEI